MMIFGSVVMDVKSNRMSDMWPADVQNWVISKVKYRF